MRFPIRLTSLILILGLAACDDEQVLYEVKADEEVPPVPSLAEMSREAMPPAQQKAAPMMAQSGAAPEALLKSLKPAEFELPLRKEPVAWDLVEIAGIMLAIHPDFEKQEETSQFREATYLSPSNESELVFFHFGPNQGGGMIENAARWYGQFTPPEGKDSSLVSFERDSDKDGLSITRIKLEGTWSGGMSEDGAMKDSMLDGIIVEGGPMGSVFVRLTGPEDDVENWDAMMRTMAGMARAPMVQTNGATMVPPQVDPRIDPDSQLSLVEGPGIRFALPATWEREQSASSMRAFQFRIPSGDPAIDPGEFVVFYFGPSGGGSAEDNIRRWASQVVPPGGEDPMDVATIETTEQNGLNMSSVYVEGTYTPTAMGPMAPAPDPKENQAVMGVIIEGGPEGPLYLRFTGPKEVIKGNGTSIATILSTMEKIP